MGEASSMAQPVGKAVSASASMARPGLLKAILTVMRKDMLLEWRGRARVNATLFFGLLTLLMFSFAMGPDHKLLGKTAPGFLWLAILLSSVLSLGESMRVERENEALDGLRLTPLDPKALFLGKSLVNLIFLALLSLLMVPVAVAIYGVDMKMGIGSMAIVLFLGCAAISAPGTLYSGVAAQARARDVLLPLLMFPILVPGLLASVKATGLVLQGDPMGQLGDWMSLLFGFSAIYWILCTLLFGKVIEE